MAEQERRRILNNIAYDADVHYWNAVAGREMVGVAAEYKKAVSRLVTVVKHRVKVEYIDKNDLLMAEVKLNEADYQWLQAINQAEVSNLALYSFAGLETNEDLSTDSVVVALKQGMTEIPDVMAVLEQRPEMQIARSQVGIQESTGKIANAQYLPKISVGINGSYSSPGYDFTSDLDPNYAVYAKVSIPLYEWGKRKNTRHASRYQIQTAQENQQKIEDQVRLEIETAYYTFTQSIDQVRLTESSLQKAAESEQMAMKKYREGRISIVEVINAQLYHQQAKVNYIQSKLNAQVARSSYHRVTCSFTL